MANFIEPSKCITVNSVKSDAKRKRIKFIAKYIIIVPMFLRLLMELSKHVS